VDDAVELRTIRTRGGGEVVGVDHEAFPVLVEDPEAVDLAGALLPAVARPASPRPALEVALATAREVELPGELTT
jgi:hypothetical protein